MTKNVPKRMSPDATETLGDICAWFTCCLAFNPASSGRSNCLKPGGWQSAEVHLWSWASQGVWFPNKCSQNRNTNMPKGDCSTPAWNVCRLLSAKKVFWETGVLVCVGKKCYALTGVIHFMQLFRKLTGQKEVRTAPMQIGLLACYANRMCPNIKRMAF